MYLVWFIEYEIEESVDKWSYGGAEYGGHGEEGQEKEDQGLCSNKDWVHNRGARIRARFSIL